MKILYLYAGIGGNRKLWDGDIEVTAVELNPDIAKIYQDFFPDDKVVVTDAHQYLLDHFEEYDFISAPSMAIPANKINERAFFEDGKVVFKEWNDDIKFNSNDHDFSTWNYVYHAMTSLFNWSGNPAATVPADSLKMDYQPDCRL